MPTIVVTSDLHLGLTPSYHLSQLAEEIAALKPDLTVLAGDLGEPLPNFEHCLDLFAPLPGEIAVLAGNHDVWAQGGHHSRDLWERLLPEATRARNMLWLEDAVWRAGDVAVAGSMAWYDYSAVDPTIPSFPQEFFKTHKHRYNNDGNFIDWDWSDVELAQRLMDGLCARLQALEEDSTVAQTVVVTHVPIFEEQLVRKPLDERWGFTNAYFGNLTLGLLVACFDKVRAVISGHTHIGRTGTTSRVPASSDLPPITVSVIASDYGKPGYVVYDTATASLTSRQTASGDAPLNP